MTKKEEAAAVAAYRADADHSHKMQFYCILTPTKAGEIAAKVYAVSDTKTHGLRVREINRAWTSRAWYECKDVWKNVWGHTMIEFDERKNRPQESFGWYGGKWGSRTDWTDAGWFCKWVRYANLEALQGTRYQYSAFREYKGDMPLVPYLRLYRRFPQVEILAKAGMSQLIQPGFLERMEADKALAGFVRGHAREIAERQYIPAEIMRARRHGWTLARTRATNQLARRLAGIPAEIDRKRLVAYLEKGDIDVADYHAYMGDLRQARLDPAAHAFPRDFHAARQAVQRQIATATAEEEARRTAAAMRTAERINRLLEKVHKQLAARVGNWTVFVPKTRADFAAEGKAMHNCIGGYFADHADGKRYCFFVRQDGVKIADVCILPSGAVQECRGPSNRPVAPEVRKAVDWLAQKIARTLRKAA